MLHQESSPAWLNQVLQWRNVVPAELNSSSSPLQSTPSGPGIQSLSRTGASIPNYDQYNGIWSCVVHGVRYIYIGIYNRGGGKKVYTNISVL